MIHRQENAEIDFLREENRQLKEAIAASWPLPLQWRLSVRQVRAVQTLLSADTICWERLALAAYGSDYPPKNAINAFIFVLRRKMQPFGMHITSLRQFGYALEDRKKWIIDLEPNNKKRINGR